MLCLATAVPATRAAAVNVSPGPAMAMVDPYRTYAGHCTPLSVEVTVVADALSGPDAFLGQANFQGHGLMSSALIPSRATGASGGPPATASSTSGPTGTGRPSS